MRYYHFFKEIVVDLVYPISLVPYFQVILQFWCFLLIPLKVLSSFGNFAGQDA